MYIAKATLSDTDAYAKLYAGRPLEPLLLCGSVFIAWRSQQALGFCAVQKKGKILWISHLFTAKKYRRQGIANALLSYLQEFAFENNIQVLELKTTRTMAPALKLYLKRGFTLLEEKDGILYLKAELPLKKGPVVAGRSDPLFL